MTVKRESGFVDGVEFVTGRRTQLTATLIDVVQRIRSIEMGFAMTQQIEIRPVQGQDCRHDVRSRYGNNLAKLRPFPA